MSGTDTSKADALTAAPTPDLSPVRHDGGDIGVLVAHGFSGSPQGVRPLAEAMARAGFTVRAPLLPGHGTTWRDLHRTTWRQWYAAIERDFVELHSRCRVVVAAGLSMGGALVTRLAEMHPQAVDGLVLVNPAYRIDDPRLVALPVLRHVVPSLPGIGNDIARTGGEAEWAYDRISLRALSSQTDLWRRTVADMPRLRAPILLAHSREDHVVPATSWQTLRDRVDPRLLTMLELPRSYHVATLDHDADLLEREAVRFVERIGADHG